MLAHILTMLAVGLLLDFVMLRIQEAFRPGRRDSDGLCPIGCPVGIG